MPDHIILDHTALSQILPLLLYQIKLSPRQLFLGKHTAEITIRNLVSLTLKNQTHLWTLLLQELGLLSQHSMIIRILSTELEKQGHQMQSQGHQKVNLHKEGISPHPG